MPCPGAGPCTAWPLTLCCLDASDDLIQPCLTGGAPVTQTLIDNSIMSASQLMWALTGRQFGMCEVLIRPCRKVCDPRSFVGLPWNNGPTPALIGGEWYNLSCGCGAGGCFCNEPCEISIPTPACEVSEVKIDGVVLNESAYKISGDRGKLVRVDGECWPECNSSLPDTEEGTWSVLLTYGRAVPQLVLDGTAEIACEILKNCVGQPCKLPQRMVTMNRQGVTIQYENAETFWPDKRTGFYLADQAIQAYNPRRLARPAGVYSVDSESWQVD